MNLGSVLGVGSVLRLALALGVGLGCPIDGRGPERGTPTVLTAGPVARVLHEGRVACLPEPARDDMGHPVTCEPSGAARLGEAIWVANDKPLPNTPTNPPTNPLVGRSPMMQLSEAELQTPARYATDAAWLAVRKLEGLTARPDGQGLLAITAFDRVDPSSAALDPYDMLLSWVPGQAPVIVEASTRDGVTSSVRLRDQIRRALADTSFPLGPPHVKIEGLALLPDGRLLLGVREVGEHWHAPRYVVRILETRWSADRPERLAAPITLRWTWTPAEPDVPRWLGLSGLEWDPEHERLLMLTSIELGERPEDLGGTLWILPLAAYEAGEPPTPVRAPNGTRLWFDHKAEAVVPLGDGRVLVVHDDDRVLTGTPRRSPHEAAFTVLGLDD